ncbi:MAG: type II secretion system protein [Planctomycetota bacterium]|nr:MAG: type II secretion system protein [Planctomycetota bacterium]
MRAVRARGFTLLEVVLALIILSVFATVCLQLRLEGLRAGRALAESQRTQRLLSDVLDLARARMLPAPRVERDDAGRVERVVWEGERAGVAFTCVEDETDAPAPMAGPDATPGAVVRVRRLTATAAGQRAVLYLPARGAP